MLAAILIIPLFFGKTIFVNNGTRLQLKYENRGGENILELFCKLLPYSISIGYCLFVTIQLAITLLRKDVESIFQSIIKKKPQKIKNPSISSKKSGNLTETSSYKSGNRAAKQHSNASGDITPGRYSGFSPSQDIDIFDNKDNILDRSTNQKTQNVENQPLNSQKYLGTSQLGLEPRSSKQTDTDFASEEYVGIPTLGDKKGHQVNDQGYRVSMMNYNANLKRTRWLILRLALFPIVPLFTQLYHRIDIFINGVRIDFERSDQNINKSKENISSLIMFILLSFQGPLNLAIFLLNPTITSTLILMRRKIKNVDLGVDEYDEEIESSVGSLSRTLDYDESVEEKRFLPKKSHFFKFGRKKEKAETQGYGAGKGYFSSESEAIDNAGKPRAIITKASTFSHEKRQKGKSKKAAKSKGLSRQINEADKYLVEYMLVNAFESDESDFEEPAFEHLESMKYEGINIQHKTQQKTPSKNSEQKENSNGLFSSESPISGWKYNLNVSSSSGSSPDYVIKPLKQASYF
ncbi:hypothetical protein BB560_001833 [Smittium megazygosporum]|uniref:Uncharacterized protein n=1 Tax=Smittium megazygosporum TaxID=133381 RepID=A0A2T9ZGJ2_9FUNG|nr:hypothetical protein BB560_001833 [Smittium megazygosporum]